MSTTPDVIAYDRAASCPYTAVSYETVVTAGSMVTSAFASVNVVDGMGSYAAALPATGGRPTTNAFTRGVTPLSAYDREMGTALGVVIAAVPPTGLPPYPFRYCMNHAPLALDQMTTHDGLPVAGSANCVVSAVEFVCASCSTNSCNGVAVFVRRTVAPTV